MLFLFQTILYALLKEYAISMTVIDSCIEKKKIQSKFKC